MTTIIVDNDDRDRPLTVDVWFPIVEPPSPEPHRYTFLPGVYYESPLAVSAADFAAIAADGPYPLVVYSHGSGGLRYIHSRYTETIASHGYVVAAPDHTGNTAVDLILQSTADPMVTALNRPDDVRAVIDELANPASAVAGGLDGHVDLERVAVTGHSFGGFTSYAVVGGYENPAGATEPDDRVDAVITLAPAASAEWLTDPMLEAVDVPSLVFGATDDTSTPIDPNVTRPWALTTGRPSYRVDLVSAEHQTFTDVCDYVDFLPTLDAVPDVIVDTIDRFAEAGCQADDMPSDRAQALINTFAVTFLEEIFRDGSPIDPKAVDMPDDIRYQARSA